MRYIVLLVVPLLAVLALACGGGGAPTTPKATPASAAETLAFLRDGDIWLTDADGGNERSLGLADVQSFSWVSADELDVVTGEDRSGHLLVDVAGEVHELPFQAGGSWSSDGSMYVVPVDRQLVVFDREGSIVAELEVKPPPEEGEKARACPLPPSSGEADSLVFGQPVFSRDGRNVLVAVNCRSRSGATGNLYASVYEASLDGATNRTLPLMTNLPSHFPPMISPDGARVSQHGIARSGACHREHGMALTDADGGGSHEVTLPMIVGLRDSEPRPACIQGGLMDYDWSPDSDAIVGSFDVTFYDELTEGTMLERLVAGLYIVPIDGSGEELLVEGAARSPAWSPSDRYIAYVAGESFGQEAEPPTIRLFDLTTRQVTDLTKGKSPAWQPQP